MIVCSKEAIETSQDSQTVTVLLSKPEDIMCEHLKCLKSSRRKELWKTRKKITSTDRVEKKMSGH